jgi:hypothetical protein
VGTTQNVADFAEATVAHVYIAIDGILCLPLWFKLFEVWMASVIVML